MNDQRNVSHRVGEELLGELFPEQPAPALCNLFGRGVIDQCGNLTVKQLLAVALGRAIRAAGLPHAEAVVALRLIWDMTDAEIEASFARGARFICCVGVKHVVPRLVTRGSISFNSTVRRVVKLDPSLRPLLIDVCGLAKRLRVALARRLGRD